MPIDREYQDQRRKAILQLLAERPMGRQIEIGRALRKLGYRVTQSTVSRDLEALGIVRREGRLHPPPAQGGRRSDREDGGVHPAGAHGRALHAGLRHRPGMAKAVAVALKSAAWPEIGGSWPRTTRSSWPRTTCTTRGWCSSG